MPTWISPREFWGIRVLGACKRPATIFSQVLSRMLKIARLRFAVTIQTKIAISMIVSGLLLGAGKVAAAELTSAITDYNNKNYVGALTQLKALNGSNSEKRQDKVHYYMALCYQAQNQINLARTEYGIVYRNSKDSNLAWNSYKALHTINKWTDHRGYEGQGNNFGKHSPPNTKAVEVARARIELQRQEEEAEQRALMQQQAMMCRRGCH